MRYRSNASLVAAQRSGVVLLVVMALLALFASVGLSFVFYAEAEGVAAQLNKDSFTRTQADVDPEDLASFFLNQLLYPTTNQYSAMRGYDLATSIYGFNPGVQNSTGVTAGTLNYTPYNGGGRATFAPPTTNDPDLGVPMFNMINNQTYWDRTQPATNKTVNFVRTPEYYGKAAFVPAAGPPATTYLAPTAPATYRYVGGANAPWTAYDTNSLFLAQVDATGQVLMPSFYRPWIAKTITQATPAARYMSLRPDLTWNNGAGAPSYSFTVNGVPVTTTFYTPDSDTPLGPDVKNLEFGSGTLQPGGTPGVGPYYNNDSYWMDLGFPILTAPNGKRYKALFAPLVMDLSNRLHMWAHGNQRGGTAPNLVHVSNQGFGPTEVNLNKLPGINAGELAKLFTLKYGGANPAGPAPTFSAGSWFSDINANALNPKAGQPNTNLSSRPFFTVIKTPTVNAITVTPAQAVAGVVVNVKVQPTSTAAGIATPFPWDFADANITANATQAVVGNGAGSELVTIISSVANPPSFKARFHQSHPVGSVVTLSTAPGFPNFPKSGGWNNGNAAELLNNPLALNLFFPAGTNRPPLPTSNQEALLRYGGTNSPALTSELFRRMPITFNPTTNPRTRNMVTLANWHLDRITGAPFLNFDRTLGAAQYLYPNPATATSYPKISGITTPNYAAPVPVPNPSAAFPWNNEFASKDWRSTMGHFLRMDLVARQAQLTAYPGAQALPSRQQLAKDIYSALIRVTGAHDPNVVASARTPTNPDYQAARWLAQLAVNIVDYIDNDNFATLANAKSASINTAFNWYSPPPPAVPPAPPEGWVYGTELPGLVMNEVYAQQEVAPINQLNVWAELLNPLANVATANNNAWLQAGVNHYYKIEIYASNPATLTPWLRNPANSQGTGFSLVAPGAPTVLPLATQTNWVPAPTSAATTAVTTEILPAINSAINPTIKTMVIRPYAAAVANTGAHETGATVTIHTTAPHGLTQAADKGKAVTITGVVDKLGNPIVGYDGTFVITAVPTTTTLQYTASAIGLAQGGSGMATFMPTTGGNAGFYVVGPAGAQYATAARVPNLPATLAVAQIGTQGMSITVPSANIATATHNAAGTLVTITTTGPAIPLTPATFVAGQQVVVTGVMAGGMPATGYNNTAINPTWTIAAAPAPTATSFSYRVPGGTVFPAAPAIGGTASLYIPQITMLLRRLANPNSAFNVTTNPYITLDYLDQIPVAPPLGPLPPIPMTVGRPQPYVAALTQQPAPAPQTFFMQNFPNATNPNLAFDWLVHLDRAPINPLELVHVSGYKPHELTQQFVTGTAASPVKFQHYAPWQDPNSLIYRFLDQTSTHYMAGTYTGSRFPGNINLNTLTELEIFQALCDAHDVTNAQFPDPWFTQPDVLAVFQKLITSRNLAQGTALPRPINASLLPTSEGSPFKSFSAATLVGTNVSFQETFFRPDPTSPVVPPTPLFLPPSLVAPPVNSTSSVHPYAQASLLQKIYNNITTTSNVFAVWWTVGYFEVVDETVRPAKLGAEIGRDQNRHIRHRFFAVVDRSAMQIGSTISTGPPTTAGAGATMKYLATSVVTPSGPIQPWNNALPYLPGNIVSAANGVAYYCIQTNTNKTPLNVANVGVNKYWQNLIQPGMLLEIDTGANAEVVAVLAPPPPPPVPPVTNSFTANFTKNHAAGVPIVIRGNPGPLTAYNPLSQSGYNPRHDTNVVLHLSVIK